MDQSKVLVKFHAKNPDAKFRPRKKDWTRKFDPAQRQRFHYKHQYKNFVFFDLSASA